MGMYDTIINHYDIGPGFNRKKLQTKTIYNTPTMSVYWLDPTGQFWVLNCDGTHDFCEDQEHPLKFKWVKNGNHGSVRHLDTMGQSQYIQKCGTVSMHHSLKLEFCFVTEL